MRTLVSALMVFIILVCGCIYFQGCTTAKNPPLITSFSASPSSISSGAATTLSWSVANATSVNIQPGIGNVAASGSTAVTPGSSTQYTLIATNSSGSNQASTRVIVTAGTTGTTATDEYDLIAHASEASWFNGADNLTFPGSRGESQGYVLVLNNATLEDNTNYTKVLVTHPKWVTDGIIKGTYTKMTDTYTIMPNDRFYAKVGFLKGADAGDVEFRVRMGPEGLMPRRLVEVTKTYNGSLTTIDVPIPDDYIGYKAFFVLEVAAKNEGAKQDWAAWVNPKVTR